MNFYQIQALVRKIKAEKNDPAPPELPPAHEEKDFFGEEDCFNGSISY